MNIAQINNKEIWESFIAQVKPKTFLQSYNWSQVNEKRGDKVFRLGIYQDDLLQAIALVVKIKARRGDFLFIPHGPVILDNKSEVISTLTSYLITLGRQEKCDFIRVSPLLEKTAENQDIFALLGYKEAPIHMMHPERSWILDITSDPETLLAQMRKTTRYCIKKSLKEDIEIEIINSASAIDNFWLVYEATAKRQSFTPFTKNYITTEFNAFKEDNQISFFFAKYKGEIVASAIILFYSDSAFYHHGASVHKYEKLNTSYLLQWSAILEAKKRNLKYYNFWGVSPKDKPSHPWSGLSLFKQGFGGADEEYLHAKDYPLTKKYKLAWIVEKIRTKMRGY
ncbi:MAG: hypothetical protein COU06_00515 [Candidatus Harrisonbacteria bacterium CG10_big_fil_rev_8_21_14_0_10_38_8]|uniref:BioF2-like acetyltransferase domain-containing protein n=1 Tax=Candidatus Harrisonbacteria bacterium CG10_big_fil_rev_8_21_14_0_10_38_8 TaxID=1974582 RepID=A0A2M6WKR0_9BACT|nr:MAG: hypothetical protein COU06_00515 [Candidatus Harrisonbacteria bacterium CG10_big_fil_rev_8_21_14_0_10_38_8]